MKESESVKIERLTTNSRDTIDDVVTRELPLTIILNNEELVTLLCSPTDLNYLAVGYLSSEGFLKNKDEIKKITVDEQKGVVRLETREEKNLPAETAFKRVLTSGCGRGASFYSFADLQEQIKIESPLNVSSLQILNLVKDFQQRSEMYKETGGVHSAALCEAEKILLFANDIGRHNAIDKIFGECILNRIAVDHKIIVTSGRISSEILIKVARKNIPLLVSRSAPTNLGVRLAQQLGITLIGFVRGQRMNVYTNSWRIITDVP
jgi:FdhD protein